MKYEFGIVRERQAIKGTCLRCGKKSTITIVSEQTINPFNKNSVGITKTQQEVVESVRRNLPILVKRWESKFICDSCFRGLKWDEKWFDKNEYDTLEEANKKLSTEP